MIVRAASGLVSPAPATSVSCKCASMVSPLAIGTAIPPCACDEFDSLSSRFAHSTIRLPDVASCKVAARPASPAPITR